MHLEFRQSSGDLVIYDRGQALHQVSAYAGRGDGLNNPDAECVQGIGPLPVGAYRVGRAQAHPRLGPRAFPLTPCAFTGTCGRSGFFIHGDNRRGDRSASHGCIIAPPDFRKKIAELRPTVLIVDR